ncbi:hypothetical protein O6H91_Y180900 [Diphasiastrum complanatum]|nr:hypothetical protein O6H91_Y180900 [Diphasiastrum complanatum]
MPRFRRFLFQLHSQKIIVEMPSDVHMWNQVSIKREMSMYSGMVKVGRSGGMSEWETKYCPWWIDFRDGTCLVTETTQYELHQKGRLVVDDADDTIAQAMVAKSMAELGPEKYVQIVDKKERKKVTSTP